MSKYDGDEWEEVTDYGWRLDMHRVIEDIDARLSALESATHTPMAEIESHIAKAEGKATGRPPRLADFRGCMTSESAAHTPSEAECKPQEAGTPMPPESPWGREPASEASKPAPITSIFAPDITSRAKLVDILNALDSHKITKREAVEGIEQIYAKPTPTEPTSELFVRMPKTAWHPGLCPACGKPDVEKPATPAQIRAAFERLGGKGGVEK